MTERYVPGALRRLVTERAAGYCEYCRCPAKYSAQSFAVEHIIPRHADGPTVADNLALACQGCNAHKSVKIIAVDPITSVSVPLFHPRQHRWRDHFSWSEDFTEIIGLTPTGRATVAVLQLNRAGLIHLRRVLYAFGEHPPVEPLQET
jgi:HNH endonuclease